MEPIDYAVGTCGICLAGMDSTYCDLVMDPIDYTVWQVLIYITPWQSEQIDFIYYRHLLWIPSRRLRKLALVVPFPRGI